MKQFIRKALYLSIVSSSLCLPVHGATLEGSNEYFTLDPVVVTANRYEENLSEAKADISVITREDIEKTHITNVEEALRKVPGIQFLNYGATGINANLSGIRINGSKDIIVLVDGVRMTNFEGMGYSGYFFSSLLNNMDNIERIEILRGGAGAKYGSSARGGVINIITRKINDNKTTIDISAGSFDAKKASLSSQGRQDAFSYNLYYTKNKQGDIKDGSGLRLPSHMEDTSYGLKVGYDLSKKSHLALAYTKTDSDFSGRDFLYKNDFKGFFNQSALTLTHDQEFNKYVSNHLTLRKSDIDSNYGQKYGGNIAPYKAANKYKYFFINDQVNFNDSHNDLVLGVDYTKGKHAGLSSITVDGKQIKMHHKMSNLSLYAQEDYHPDPSWTLSYGIRFDAPDGDKYGANYAHHLSHSYKVGFDFSEKDSVYISRNDYYVLPSMSQLYDPEYGNAKLKPAEGYTLNFGYTKKIADSNIVTFNWFRTKAECTFGYDEKRYTNFSHGISRGWNAQWRVQLNDHWSANLGWGHLYHFERGDTLSSGYYPKDKATFAINYASKKWEATLDGFYFMRRLNPFIQKKLENEDKTKGWPDNNYGIYNLNVAYSPNKDMQIYLKVSNIFDTLWAEHTNVIWGGDEGDWYSMPGRSFTLGMKYTF